MSCLAALAVAGQLVAGPAGEARVRRHVPTIEALGTAVPLDPDGTPSLEGGGGETCLAGRYEPGKPVLLLARAGTGTCTAVTGRVGEQEHGGACTVLVGAERCPGAYWLGAIGARGPYRRLVARPVTDGAALARLRELVARSPLAKAAEGRWASHLPDLGVTLRVGADEAWTFPEVPASPVLARTRPGRTPGEGPWIAVSKGKAVLAAGPLAHGEPSGFELDGRSYVLLGAAGCTECGFVWEEIHAMEAQGLRLVHVSRADEN